MIQYVMLSYLTNLTIMYHAFCKITNDWLSTCKTGFKRTTRFGSYISGITLATCGESYTSFRIKPVVVIIATIDKYHDLHFYPEVHISEVLYASLTMILTALCVFRGQNFPSHYLKDALLLKRNGVSLTFVYIILIFDKLLGSNAP